MRKNIPIYIDYESILIIAENNVYSRNLVSIFRNRALLFLDMTEKEIDEMDDIPDNTNWNVISKYLSDRMMIAPKPGKDVFEKFHNQYSTDKIFEEFRGFVFILNIPVDRARSLRDSTGIWIISIDEIDNDGEFLILEDIYINKHYLTPNSIYDADPANGWIGLLKESRIKKLPPLNEIIVYDNFLNDYNGDYRKYPYDRKKKINKKYWPYTYIGLENLLLLFDALFPQNHMDSNPLKIVIMVPKRKDHEDIFELRIKDWVEEIKRLRTYRIIVSCILIGNHPVHPRTLYTNYFVLETDKGFKIFEPVPFSTTVKKDGDSRNSVSMQSIFHAPNSQDNIIDTSYNFFLRDIGIQLRNANNNADDKSNLHIGDEMGTDYFALFEEIDFE